MIIGIDGNEANVQERVGVNQYAWEVLWNIYKLSDEWKDNHKVVIFLKDKPRELPPEKEYWKYRILEGSGLWIIKKLTPEIILGKEKIDVLWSPSHYVPPILTKPRVCSIMDLGYLKFSEQFKKRDFWQLKIWSAWSIIVSKYIITISQSSKKEIVRRYPFASRRVRVTLLSYDNNRFNKDISVNDVRRVKAKYTMGSDYVLFMSTLKPSKNIDGLLRAWKIVQEDNRGVKLMIAGKRGWMYEKVFSLVKELGLEKDVLFTGFVKEEEKPALIKGARAFVMPSFWEGFGLDVLSAMACGVAVVISDRGSLREIAGDAAVYVVPESEESIAEGIRKVLKMEKKSYNSLVERGLKRVKLFSWEKTARETLEVITGA